MSNATMFMLVNYAVMPFWLLMLVLPHHKITNILVHSGVVPMIYGVVYACYFVIGFVMGGPEGGSMGSLEGLMIAFTSETAIIAGWVHYLVFDMFVGSWQVRDARRVGIPHVAILIPLILTFVAGPLGLMIYVIMRYFWKQRFTLDEVAA